MLRDGCFIIFRKIKQTKFTLMEENRRTFLYKLLLNIYWKVYLIGFQMEFPFSTSSKSFRDYTGH